MTDETASAGRTAASPVRLPAIIGMFGRRNTPAVRIEPPVTLARATTPPATPGPAFYRIYRQTAARVDVTVEDALAVPAIWACVSAIAESIAASEWTIFHKDPKTGDREYVENSIYDLLNYAPNPEMTAIEFKEFLYVSAALTHGGLAEIETDSAGRPVYLWPISWDRWQPWRDRNDKLVFRIRNNGKPDSLLPPEKVFVIRGKSLDGDNALPIVHYARETIAHAIAVKEFGSSFFGNGATLSGVLETDEQLSQEQNELVTDGFRQAFAGSREAWGVFTATHGFKWKPLGVEPEKGQMIETCYQIVEEIARYYRMPLHKIQHLQKATYNNIEEQGIEFTRDTLVPWAERGSQQAQVKLLRRVPRMRCRIELDWLAEGNGVDKAEEDSKRIHMGDMSPNEVRKKRGRNWVEGGDIRVMQSGMSTLDKIETPPASDNRTPGEALDRALASKADAAVQETVEHLARAAEGLRLIGNARVA